MGAIEMQRAASAEEAELHGGSVPVDHGEDFFRTLTPAGGSTRWIPACSAGESVGRERQVEHRIVILLDLSGWRLRQHPFPLALSSRHI